MPQKQIEAKITDIRDGIATKKQEAHESYIKQ
jgi:hypothetical protein